MCDFETDLAGIIHKLCALIRAYNFLFPSANDGESISVQYKTESFDHANTLTNNSVLLIRPLLSASTSVTICVTVCSVLFAYIRS